jgi:hypothetical protein
VSDYGDVAISAVELAKTGMGPRPAWNAAAKRRFPDSSSMQTKSCPRGAFLGLCAAGLVRGLDERVVDGRLGRNAGYAVEAVRILRGNDFADPTAKELWGLVCGNVIKKHNHQMDVVLALWGKGLIKVT